MSVSTIAMIAPDEERRATCPAGNSPRPHVTPAAVTRRSPCSAIRSASAYAPPPRMASSASVMGASYAAHARCRRRISGLAWSRIAASTGRPVSIAGMADEVLVERVGRRHQHRQTGAAAAGATPLLAQARHGAGEADRDRAVQHADVDAELERVRRHDGPQLARRQPPLELAPLLGRVAGPVGRDARRAGAARGCAIVSRATRCTTSTMRRERPKQITRRSRATSSAIIAAASASADARSPVSGSSSVGFHRATVRSGRAAPSPLTTSTRSPHQLRHHLGRVRHRRRCEQELRRRADRGADAAQTADHVGDVRAEHAPVDVRLVDHDVRQVREHVAPAVGVRADADVQHVGVREQQVRVPPRHRAGRLVGVAVVQRRPQRRGPGAATSASAPGPGPAPSSASRYRARAWGSSSSAAITGSAYASVLPLAVPVTTPTCAPVRDRSQTSRWCEYSSVMPPPTSADHNRGSRSSGNGTGDGGRAGSSSTCASRSSLGGRPSASTSSHGLRMGIPTGSGSAVAPRASTRSVSAPDFALLFAGRALLGPRRCHRAGRDHLRRLSTSWPRRRFSASCSVAIGHCAGSSFPCWSGRYGALSRCSRPSRRLPAPTRAICCGSPAVGVGRAGVFVYARIWQLAVAGIVFGAGEAIFMPASTALVPETVSLQNAAVGENAIVLSVAGGDDDRRAGPRRRAGGDREPRRRARGARRLLRWCRRRS